MKERNTKSIKNYHNRAKSTDKWLWHHNNPTNQISWYTEQNKQKHAAYAHSPPPPSQTHSIMMEWPEYRFCLHVREGSIDCCNVFVTLSNEGRSLHCVALRCCIHSLHAFMTGITIISLSTLEITRHAGLVRVIQCVTLWLQKLASQQMRWRLSWVPAAEL